MIIKFKIRGLPPSYNAHFKINYGLKQVYLSSNTRNYKTLVKMSMPSVEFPPNSLFEIQIKYYYSWYYKNSTPRKLDIQNLDKLLIDAIFEKLGIDDSRLWSVSGYKVHTEEEPFTEVELKIL